MRKKSQVLLIGLVAAIALVVAYAAAPAMPGNAPVVRKSAPSAVAPTDEPTDAEPSPVEETPLDSAAAVDEVQMEEVGQSDGDESPDAAEPQASLAEAIDGEVTPEAVDSMEELLEAPHEASVALVCVPQELSATDVQARLNETAGEGAVSVYPVIDGVMEVHFEPEAVPMAEGMAWLETFDFVQDVQPNFVYEDADGDPLEQGADQDAKQQAEDPEDQGDASSGEDESTQDTAQENEPADEPSELDDSRAGDPANATPQQPGEVASTSTAPSASEPTQDAVNAEDEASVSPEGTTVTVTSLSSDTYSKLQWNLRSINVKSAWDAKKTGAGVAVAVIDAGFDVNHPDMKGVYVGARNVVSGGSNVSGNSHGHEVASVIAAKQGNGFGTSGVAPGAKVVPVMASKTGYTTANLIKAYEYILSVRSQYNIKVINTSFGFDWSNPSTGDLLVYQKIDEAYAAGIVSVGSAGNNGRVLCHCPCDYGNVVGVMGLEYSGFNAATYTQHDEDKVVRSGSSNYNGAGEICKNISAPGFRVPNLLNGSKSDTYTLSWGTSFAAPHVCATLALMFEANPSLTPAQAISALYSSARGKGATGWDAYYGYGEIDAGSAVEYAQNSRWYDGAAFEVASQGNKAGVYQRSQTVDNRVLKAEVNVVGPITGPDTVAVGTASRFTVSQAYPFIYRWSCDNGSSSGASNAFAPVAQRVGTATITATLVSDPSIVLTKTVNVTQGNVANATVNGIGYQNFTGKAVTPKPVVKMSGLTLVENTDYTLSYANNVNPGTATVVVRGKGNYTGTKNVTFVIVEPPATVAYQTHVQTYGWQAWRRNGAQAGTTGQAKRLEGINIRLEGARYGGGIQYRPHVQTYGWQGWVANGAMAGTTGLAKRLEAIQVQLYGEMASRYDVWYRVHAQTFGWMGWAANGASAGTAGYAKRLEAIQVVLRPKGSGPPGGTANAFRQR